MLKRKNKLSDEQKTSRKSIGNFVLLILFCCCLAIECFALYTKHYDLRFFSRTLMVPLLILRFFNKEHISSTQIFIYLVLLLSWLGDILNLSIYDKIQYLASSFYTLSYITFGIILYNFRDKKKLFFNYVFFAVFTILCAIVFLVFNFPSLNDILINIHIIIHSSMLIYALVWAFAVRKEMRMHSLKYFIPSIFCMMLANGIYALDYYKINTGVHYLTYRHTSVDCMVAICYAMGIFLFTEVIRNIKYLKNESEKLE